MALLNAALFVCLPTVWLFLLLAASVGGESSRLLFSQTYPESGSSVTAQCENAQVSRFQDIGTLEFRINGTATYIVTRDCSAENITEVPQDQMGGRMNYLISNGKLLLQWDSLQATDSGDLYSCGVRKCGVPETLWSQNASITVIVSAGWLSISGNLVSYENSPAANNTFACNGQLSYPGGNVTLMRTKFSGASDTLAPQTLAIDALGNVNSSFSVGVPSRADHNDMFTCLAGNTLNSDVGSKRSEAAYLLVDYAPNGQLVRYSQGLNVSKLADNQYQVNVTSGAGGTVWCAVDANPSATVVLWQQAGPPGLVTLTNGSNQGVVTLLPYNAHAQVAVVCAWQYVSTNFPALDQQNSSLFTITFGEAITVKIDPPASTDLTWLVIVGVLLGVVLIAALVFLVWYYKFQPQTASSAKVQSQQADQVRPPTVNEPVKTLQKRQLEAAPDDFRSEFPFHLVSVVEQAGCRRPIVDSSAQSIFEYLKEPIFPLQPSMLLVDDTLDFDKQSEMQFAALKPAELLSIPAY